MQLHDLEVYTLSRVISQMSWRMYERFSWQDRKLFGDQWIRAVDSIGANIAEAFGRYHFRDKNVFHYTARGSLLEAIHWSELLRERQKISVEELRILLEHLNRLHHQLNNYIRVTRAQINND